MLICSNKSLSRPPNFAPKCRVVAGARGGSTAHRILRCKIAFPPGTEPRSKKQQPTALTLGHIGSLMSAVSHFRNSRRAVTVVTDTAAEPQRGLKASTSSKVATPCIGDRRVITSDNVRRADYESSRRFVARHDLDLQCRS